MDGDADFPELPPHIHYLVKDREYGLECRRCGAKGPSSYFKTFACPFQEKMDEPNNRPLQQTAARETPKESVEDVASGSVGTGDATTLCPSKDKGKGQDDGTGNDVENLEDLEVEIFQMELLQQELEELELEELEQQMKEISMQEYMLEHELEMADKVDYGDKHFFDPCSKMPGVPQVVSYPALPQDKDSVKEKEDCEEKREEKKSTEKWGEIWQGSPYRCACGGETKGSATTFTMQGPKSLVSIQLEWLVVCKWPLTSITQFRFNCFPLFSHVGVDVLETLPMGTMEIEDAMVSFQQQPDPAPVDQTAETNDSEVQRILREPTLELGAVQVLWLSVCCSYWAYLLEI